MPRLGVTVSVLRRRTVTEIRIVVHDESVAETQHSEEFWDQCSEITDSMQGASTFE